MEIYTNVISAITSASNDQRRPEELGFSLVVFFSDKSIAPR